MSCNEHVTGLEQNNATCNNGLTDTKRNIPILHWVQGNRMNVKVKVILVSNGQQGYVATENTAGPVLW